MAAENNLIAESYRSEIIRRRSRWFLVFLLLFLGFCVITVININSGNVHITLNRIFRIIFTGQGDFKEVNIIWRIRLPRILTAALMGGALSLSGFLLQTFFENPIAGPYVLGISSGAKMVVAMVMIFSLRHMVSLSSYAMIGAAFIGSLVATGFILLVSRKIKNMAALLVAGIMIGYICNALTDFIINFASDTEVANLHYWSQGSFSGMSWSNVYISAFIVLITFAVTMFFSKQIGAYQLGESYAQSIGVNIRMFRVILILLSSILSATVTAFAGPISFVGIAVPFLIKGAMGTSKPLVVIPATFIGGAVFCMFCDLIARLAFAPMELNISTVTSIFGAPVVIYMMIHRRRTRR